MIKKRDNNTTAGTRHSTQHTAHSTFKHAGAHDKRLKQKIQSMASEHGEPRTWGKATPSSAVSITLLVLGYCLLLVGGAGAACLTKELYAQGYEAYKDVTCIGAYAFQGYTNDVRIDRGLGKLKTIETYAFENFKGTLIFSDRFPLLTSVKNCYFDKLFISLLS